MAGNLVYKIADILYALSDWSETYRLTDIPVKTLVKT